jgi:hypothetical protein
MNAQPHSGCGLQAQDFGDLSSGLGGLGELWRIFCQIKVRLGKNQTTFLGRA